MSYSIEAGSVEGLGGGLHAVMKAVKHAATYGESTSENGAHMFGRVPHVAPEAWLHILYPGLDNAALAGLESALGRSIPDPYRALLKRTNGLYLFSGALSLYGLRRDYSRNPAIREPFDLGDPNVRERPKAAKREWFIFAFYKADGSNAYIDPDDSRVYRASRDVSRPRLNQWDSLDAFLEVEVQRLEGHFDSGRRLDASRATSPDSSTP